MKRKSYPVRTVEAAAVRPLRQRVLRPHQRPEELVYPGDEDEESRHLVALDEAGEIAAIASIYRMAHPDQDVGEWRLRGMASSPEARGSGAGGAVLLAALAYAASVSPSAVWCNARVGVCDFYTHFGFHRRGEIFEIEPIGPHCLMTRTLEVPREMP
jgi:predicted GNAT family N-acyltransferase